MLEERKQEWISAYVDGELSPSDCGMVEQWLEAEPLCRELHHELMQLRGDFESLRAAGPDDVLGRDLTADIFSLLDHLPSRHSESHLDSSRSSESVDPAQSHPTTQLPADIAAGTDRGANLVVLRLLAIAAALTLLVFLSLPDNTKPSTAEVGPDDGPKSGSPTVPTGDPPKVPRTPNGDSTRPATPDAEFVSARPASFILVEVELTSKGLTRESMNSALQQAGIGQANGVPIDNSLETALTNSRFFQNADDGSTDEKPKAGEESEAEGAAQLEGMVYCVLNGPQLDTIWDYLAKEKGAGAVSNMAIDVVFLDNDLSLFDMLHRSAEFQIADAESTRPIPKDGTSPLRLRAQRILLSAALQTKLGRGLRVLAVPAVSVLSGVLRNGDNTNEDGAEEGEERGDTPDVTEQQMEAMASQTTGVLFIVRSSPAVGDEAK